MTLIRAKSQYNTLLNVIDEIKATEEFLRLIKQ